MKNNKQLMQTSYLGILTAGNENCFSEEYILKQIRYFNH